MVKKSTGIGKRLLTLCPHGFFRKMFIAVIAIQVAGMMPLDTHAETIFTETFDNLPDQEIVGDCLWEGYPGNCALVPQNWDFTYSRDRNDTNPPAEILDGIGKEGKGFRVYDESYGSRSQWGHDIQLAKHFVPNQYPELWISLWIRFNPDLDTTGLGAAKIFRMGHYNPRVIDGTTATPVVNTNLVTDEGPTTSGLLFYDVTSVSNGTFRHKIALRGDPDYKIGFKYNGYEFEFRDENGELPLEDRTWTGTYGDGEWHKFEVGMIMNSSPGAEDGQALVYLDGIYQGGRTDIPWLGSGHDPGVTGFNMFTIAGNANFIWDEQSNAEQWFYDIDNVEICTTRCIAPNPPSALSVE